MSQQENLAIGARWFTEFWGAQFNPDVIDELAFEGAAELIADDEHVVAQWVGGGTHA